MTTTASPTVDLDLYERDGFVVVGDVIGQDVIDRLRRACDDLLGRLDEPGIESVLDYVTDDHGTRHPRRIKSPHRHHPVFDEVMRSDAILDLVEQMIGPDIRLYGTKLNLKLSHGAHEAVEWHQDVAYTPHTNDDFLAVGLPLDDMDATNGTMLMVPGSHRGGIYDHHENGRFVGTIDYRHLGDVLDRAVPVAVPVGSVSIHHTRTLHASGPNTSRRHRRLWLLNYRAADAWPLVGCGLPGDHHICAGRDFHEYLDLIVRGEHREPRLDAGVVRLPLPASGDRTTIYNTQTDARSFWSEGQR